MVNKRYWDGTVSDVDSPISYSTTFTGTENPLSEGGVWTNLAAGGYAAMQKGAVAGVATSTNASNCAAFISTPDFTAYANQSVSITLSGSIANQGALVHFDASANGYRLAAVSPTVLRLSVVNAGTATPLGADYTVPTLVGGDIITLSITSDVLTPSVNGSPLSTRTDSTHTTGAPGIYSFNFGRTTDFSCTSL